MGRGSYRGGSTPVGWNANRYVAPSLTGRTRQGKALIKDLTARTAQSRAELAEQDRLARKRHGLAPRKTPAADPPVMTAATSAALTRKRRKDEAKAFTVTVVKRRRPKR